VLGEKNQTEIKIKNQNVSHESVTIFIYGSQVLSPRRKLKNKNKQKTYNQYLAYE